jgi:transcriptional regulator with XRE-family HTH domain
MEVMENIRIILGANIKRLRKRAGIRTQEELAERSKLSEQMVKLVETGKRWPSPATTEAIAKAIGVTISELFGEESQAGSLPVSRTLRKMACIPDEIYELAEDIGIDDEIWSGVLGALKKRKEIIERSKKNSQIS